MTKIVLQYTFISGAILFMACNVMQTGKSIVPQTYVKVPYTNLVLKELSQTAQVYPGTPGCSLADLRPFGWKTVDTGLVDMRSPDEYSNQIESIYQEGYLDYAQTRLEYPDRYQSIPEMSYEEFLSTCNVFPEVDFSKYSVLGNDATGIGCNVTFEKQVHRDDKNMTILYELTVVEEGSCEKTVHNRNLIQVPKILSNYNVTFSESNRKD